MTKEERLRGILSDLFGADIQEIANVTKAIKAETGEKLGAILAAQADQEARIAAVEGRFERKHPSTFNINTGGSDDGKRTYFGWDLARQGTEMVHRLNQMKKDGGFVVEIPDGERREQMAKFYIDLILATCADDLDAKRRLSEWRRKAALAEGAGSTGGYLVPEEFETELLAFARLNSVAMQYCRIWPMSTDTKRIPAEGASVSVSWTGEGTQLSETEPTVGEVVLEAKKVGAYSKASNEIVMDSTIDIVSWLTELFAEAIGQELDNQIFNGGGTPVSGILTAACGNSVILATGNTSFSAIHADDLSRVISILPTNKKGGGRFFFHREVLHYLFTQKTTTDAYVYGVPGSAFPTQIWGYPFSEVEKLPSMSDDASNTAFGAFGNLRYFAVGRKLASTTLFVDPYGLMDWDQVRFRVINRWALKIAMASALVRVMTAAN